MAKLGNRPLLDISGPVVIPISLLWPAFGPSLDQADIDRVLGPWG